MPVRIFNRQQTWLLPPTLDELIPDDPTASYVVMGKGLLPGDRGTCYQVVGEVTAHQA